MGSFNLQFNEAIQYAEARDVVLPDVYYGLGKMRGRAATVSGLASLSQIRYVLDQFNRALADGHSLDDFKEMVRTSGVDIKLPDYRLNTIFRTNIQTAYSHGRYQQQMSVIDSRPYWMYDAINDTRTRPTHQEMDNTILPADSAWWKSHYPPLGFNCRCAVISLTKKQAEARGISTSEPDTAPDSGFGLQVMDYDVSLNNLFEQTTDKLSQDFNFGAKYVQMLKLEINTVKNAELKLNAMLSQTQVTGPVKNQFVNILKTLSDKDVNTNGLEARLINDYLQNKSGAIKQFLRERSKLIVDTVAAEWILSSFKNVENVVKNTTNNIYTGIPAKNKKELLTAFTDDAIVQLISPLSFSKDVEVAKRFAEGATGVVLYLEGSTGYGIDVIQAGATTAQALREKEVILLSGTKIEVTRVEYTPEGSTNIYARITDKESTRNY